MPGGFGCGFGGCGGGCGCHGGCHGGCFGGCRGGCGCRGGPPLSHYGGGGGCGGGCDLGYYATGPIDGCISGCLFPVLTVVGLVALAVGFFVFI